MQEREVQPVERPLAVLPARAALLLGRRYIGMEVSPDYATIAQQRLRKKGGENPMNTDDEKRTPRYPHRQRSTAPRDGFWATCLQCRHKFATPKAWIVKYLARIGYQADNAA